MVEVKKFLRVGHRPGESLSHRPLVYGLMAKTGREEWP